MFRILKKMRQIIFNNLNFKQITNLYKLVKNQMLLMKIMYIKKMMYNYIRLNLKLIRHFYNLISVKASKEVSMKILLTYNIIKNNNLIISKTILTIIKKL